MNELALAIFAVVLAITLGVTYWASKRTSTATEFWAAGRGISGAQNGFAIAGDYMSASSFLGFAGLIFFFGLDGFIGLVAALVAFVPVLLLLAERMRNAGKLHGRRRAGLPPQRAAGTDGRGRWARWRSCSSTCSRRWSARAC